MLNRQRLDDAADQNNSASLVERIFALATEQIQTRKLQAGHRLPTVRQLAQDCEVSRDTASRAYDMLMARGHIESRRGSGYFVKASPRDRQWPPTASLGTTQMRPTGERYELLYPTQGWEDAPGLGCLPLSWMNETDMTSAVRAVGRVSPRSLLAPTDPQGYLPLRQHLQLLLHDRGVRTEPRQLIVTGGAADAMNLIVTSYLREPGETVLIEEPCSFQTKDRLLAAGLDFAAVPRMVDGPDIDVLRAQCEKHKPRFFFCNSVLHNPTSTSLSPHKAFQILRLADEFNLTLVEDDSYSDLLPAAGASNIARLATLDQLQRVIYIGSFSATLGPGLRSGFIAASPEHTRWLLLYRIAMCIGGSTLNERVLYRLLTQGNYRHHCEQLRTRLDERRESVAEQLQQMGFELAPTPTAGVFLWAALRDGRDAGAIADHLGEQGHLLAAGRIFGTAKVLSAFMRFNIATSFNSPSMQALAELIGR